MVQELNICMQISTQFWYNVLHWSCHISSQNTISFFMLFSLFTLILSNVSYSGNINPSYYTENVKTLKILNLQHPCTNTNKIHIKTDILMPRLHVASGTFSWNFLKHGVMHSPTKHEEHWYLDRFCFVAVEQNRHLLKLESLSGKCDPTSLNRISSGTPRARPCFAYFFLMSCMFPCTAYSHDE